MEVNNIDEWDSWDMCEFLIEMGVVTEGEVALLTDIHGLGSATPDDIVYARTGYRSFNQWYEEEFGEDFE